MLRLFFLIAAIVISGLIILDAIISVSAAFGEVSQYAKYVLLPVTLLLAIYALLDVFNIWSSNAKPSIVFSVAITALVIWIAARDGVEATKETFKQTETLSGNAGNQMRAVEKDLEINK